MGHYHACEEPKGWGSLYFKVEFVCKIFTAYICCNKATTLKDTKPHSPNVAKKVLQGRIKENFKGHNAAVALKNK